MAKNQLTPEAVVALNAMAEAFAPKKDKKEKKKFVLLVDGAIQDAVIPSMADVKDAATAIVMSNLANGRKAPKIEYAEVVDTISINVPLAASGETKTEAENESEEV